MVFVYKPTEFGGSFTTILLALANGYHTIFNKSEDHIERSDFFKSIDVGIKPCYICKQLYRPRKPSLDVIILILLDPSHQNASRTAKFESSTLAPNLGEHSQHSAGFS